jgi:hypothetical protein
MKNESSSYNISFLILTRRPDDALQFQGAEVVIFYVNFHKIRDCMNITGWNKHNHKRTLSGTKPTSVNGMKIVCTETPALL